MEMVVTNHIIRRYMKRTRSYMHPHDIKQIIEKTFNEAETIVTYKQFSKFAKDQPEDVIIKAINNFVIIATVREKIRLVTCFRERSIQKFYKFAGQVLNAPIEYETCLQ